MEIVAGALPSLLPKLAKLVQDEYNLQKEVKGGIRFLKAELESMEVVLEKISETPADKLDKQDKIWARDVRELSYDIEDKIDTFMVRCKAGNKITEAEQHDFNKKVIGGSLKWLARPKIRRPNWLKRFNIRREIATDIRDIKRQVHEVHERRCRYQLKDNPSDNRPINVDPRALVRYEDMRKLVGIDEARDEVIKILMQGHEVSKQQQDKIVSIVGFGGLGKTTLANVVYDNLKGEFDCWAFVSVSQTPDMMELVNNLFYELKRTYNEKRKKVMGLSEPNWEKSDEQFDKRNNSSITGVIDKLREFLPEKRYIIVIDDIWDIKHWEPIRCALPLNNVGCKIITTTRILSVAKEVGGAYSMKRLSDDSSRKLFYGRIFGHEGKDKCPDLWPDEVSISNKILDKCAGVPLAIITIAGLLASKERNKSEWFEVWSSIGTGIENNADVVNMRNVLLLSYYDLPSPIRTCFLYLSMFPEDYGIDKRRLIWLWIAEGFIPEKQERSLFEEGESYFNELINRSLIQPVYDRDNMMVSSCRVHDVVLDLIHSLSREENFITTMNDAVDMSKSQKIRRLSLQNGKVNEGAHGATVSMKQVRSVAAFSSSIHLIPAPSRFEVVRVLQLENCDLSHSYNLKDIGKLVQLRLLGLKSTKIDHLPEEIGNLQLLQVLDISKNGSVSLPCSIVQLKQLKCLYIDRYSRTEGIGSLTSLEELSRLDLYKAAEGPIGIMQLLGQLTKLRVLDIDCFYMEQECMLVESLHKIQNIQHLSIYFLEGTGRGTLDKWVGPQSLRSLSIDGYYFSKLPDWIRHSHVPNLSFLKIRVVKLQQEDLEILGRLPDLCDLDMYLGPMCSDEKYCVDTWEFVISDGFFPRLLHFKLRGDYERVVFEQGAMPRLKSLDLMVPRAVWGQWREIPDWGFENLSSLQDLHVGLLGGKHAAVEAKAALRSIAQVHPNHPSVSAVGYGR